jgi:hypothetical protein
VEGHIRRLTVNQRRSEIGPPVATGRAGGYLAHVTSRLRHSWPELSFGELRLVAATGHAGQHAVLGLVWTEKGSEAMGRRQATFRKGSARNNATYAQALRDVRSLRGETQQVLGRLLGWSVSMVSRFEAATERPDRATHQRYCALAPTEELRQQLTTAYEALPPLNGNQRRLAW